jgi:hypothetical protein
VGALIASAQLAMIARERLMRLDPAERRALLDMVRTGRGRPSRLSPAQRDELTRLVAKMTAPAQR